MIKFKYKDKIYETPNLSKKLKRLKILESDIEILHEEIPLPQKEEKVDTIPLFYKKENDLTHYSIIKKEGYEFYKNIIVRIHYLPF